MMNHVYLVVQANENVTTNPQLMKRLNWSICHWLAEPDSFRTLTGSHQMRFEAYRQFVEQENGLLADEIIRAVINSNKLTGGNKFVDEIKNLIGIRVETRGPGRPATEE